MQHRKRQITLKQRMGLCLAAFFAAFAMQLTLNGYQSRAVQAVQDAQMGCFNAISRFQGGVESWRTTAGRTASRRRSLTGCSRHLPPATHGSGASVPA